MLKQHSLWKLTSAVSLVLMLGAAGVQADRHHHDGYSGATDSYSGATDKDGGWQHHNRARHHDNRGRRDHNRHHDRDRHHDRELERERRRALERFERRRERDYRRFDERRFASEKERGRAYRELAREHKARLREILGDSRYRQERRRHDGYDNRGYDDPEDAMIHRIIREILDR